MTPVRENQGHRRTAQRVLTEIRCLTCCGDEYFEATIHNASRDGIYMECDHEVKPGEKVRTHLLQIPPGGIDTLETNESTGTVRWCRTPVDCSRRRWGLGVGFSRVPR
jgi:hypothetical protein